MPITSSDCVSLAHVFCLGASCSLLDKIKGDRKSKVQKELSAEARFVKESGFTAKKFDIETGMCLPTPSCAYMVLCS